MISARRQTVAVWVIVAAGYLLLMSGHIYANDEETLFQITDSLATHGTPLVSADVWGIIPSPIARPGQQRIATIFGPGQPLLSVPFLWLGKLAARGVERPYAAFTMRFVMLAFNSFITAATSALLCYFARSLKYPPSAATALALCYAAGTFAAIQARTFFAEPLTALLLLLAFVLIRESAPSHRTARQIALLLAASGAATTYALTVKAHALLFLPVLALYVALTATPALHALKRRVGWKRIAHRGVWWIAGGAVPGGMLLLYNRWLYGNPFSTGYGFHPDIGAGTTPFLTGLFGLTISSGKGVLWYAPPLLFALIGLPSFTRRFPLEAATIMLATLLSFGFYAPLRLWSGDGAWGPRFLLMVLPWLLLPALPLLHWLLTPGKDRVKTVARLAAFCVLLAGVFVQSLAIAVSFDRPILAVPNDNARYFHPSSSPITVSLFTVQRQWQRWRMWRFPPANTMRLETGFRSPESDNPAASFPRWTDGAASVSLHPRAGSALRVKLTYFDHRPGSQRTVATPVEVFLGDTPLTAVDRLPIAPGNEGFILAYDLSPALLHDAGDRLFIRSPTWNPGTAGAGERHEVLGIFVNNLEVWADGVPLEIQRTPSLPPIPATPHAIWLWANFPNTPHLLDWWPVLLYDAQMPHGATAMLSSGILGFTACLLGVGMWLLRSAPTPRLESLSVGKGSSVVSDS